jgi:hypothetical protein
MSDSTVRVGFGTLRRCLTNVVHHGAAETHSVDAEARLLSKNRRFIETH